jgi:putative inorganic carbon (HCO3(-)) transporter
MRLVPRVATDTTLERDRIGWNRPLPPRSEFSAFSTSSTVTVPRSAAVAYTLALVTVVWGSVAFGAVYSWAFWPLALLAVAAGLAGWLAASKDHTTYAVRPAFSRGFVLALAGVVTAVLVQLIPLPQTILLDINPSGLLLRQQLDLAIAGATGAQALSIAPSAGWVALALLVSFIILLLGTTRLLSIQGPRTLARALIIFGVVLALVGIIQKPLYAGRIYGFWPPEEAGNPFGPFINRNHFAGWMLMMLPLALGYLCAGLARAMRRTEPTWRGRLIWLLTPEANKLILTAGGIAIMGLALVLTLSRSGIIALVLALLVMGWLVVRQLPGRWRKLIAAGYLVLLAIILVAWVGPDALMHRFGKGAFEDGRLGAWADARDTMGRHWLTGTGLNTYQFSNLVYQRHNMTAFVSAAHNDYLQLAAEGGLLLTVPAAICVALFIRDVRRRLREDKSSSAYWFRAGAVTALVAIGLQETVEFSLQMPGNAALFAVVSAIALHRAPTRGPGKQGM